MNAPHDTTSRDFSVIDIGVGTLLMVAAIFSNNIPFVGSTFFLLGLAVMMLGSPRLAFESLVLGMLALCANQAIVLKTTIWAFGRFVLLLGAAGRFLAIDQIGNRFALLKEGRYITLCMFCTVAALTSLAAGNRPEIATLKVFLFWFSLSGLWAGVSCLKAMHRDVAPWMIKITATTCCLNVLALLLGIARNFREIEYTQGLYNLGFYHAQTVGPVCGMMIVYLASVWLFTSYRNRWICMPIGAVLLYSVSLSGSRTGALVLIAGLGSLLLLTLAWRGTRWHRIRLNMSRGALVAAVAGVLAIVVFADVAMRGRISASARTFIAKTKNAGDDLTFQDITASRLQLIDRGLMNFWQSPWIGNGFQMYADREWTRNTTIMTSQVEKGFLPAAILEETGIFGTTFFVIFLWQAIAYYVRDRNIPGLAGFIALLAMNMGECSFFSFAGHGGLIWIYVAAADLLGMRTKVATRDVRPIPSAVVPRLAIGRAAAL